MNQLKKKLFLEEDDHFNIDNHKNNKRSSKKILEKYQEIVNFEISASELDTLLNETEHLVKFIFKFFKNIKRYF